MRGNFHLLNSLVALISGLVMIDPIRAQAHGLSADEVAKKLADLQHLEKSIQKTRQAATGQPLTVLKEAAGSPNRALGLFIDAVKEIEFKRKDRTESDFQQWLSKSHDAHYLRGPGAAETAQLHLQYLLLTIQASQAESQEEKASLINALTSYIDKLGQIDEKTAMRREFMEMDVLSSPVARFLKLDQSISKPEHWSLQPNDVPGMYEQTILPPLRAQKDLIQLQSAWQKQMQQRAAIAATRKRPAEEIRYKEIEQPQMQFLMLKDLLTAGQKSAYDAILRHIQEYPAHEKTDRWITFLRQYLGQTSPAAQ